MPARANKRQPPKLLPRGSNHLPAEEVLRRQRERLIEAMVHAVAMHGYASTSVSMLASEAHVARPAFYRAFPAGKDECFIAAYDAVVSRLAASASKAYETAGGGLSGIEAAFRAVTMEMAQRPEVARLCLIEITALGVPGLKHRDAMLDRIASLLADALQITDKEASHTKIRALVGGGYQLLYLAVAEDRVSDLPTLVPDILYMVLAYRLGPQTKEPESQ
jgi:AcrR family transcriptional regulator